MIALRFHKSEKTRKGRGRGSGLIARGAAKSQWVQFRARRETINEEIRCGAVGLWNGWLNAIFDVVGREAVEANSVVY